MHLDYGTDNCSGTTVSKFYRSRFLTSYIASHAMFAPLHHRLSKTTDSYCAQRTVLNILQPMYVRLNAVFHVSYKQTG